MSEIQKDKPAYEVTHLEDGEPVYDFKDRGVTVQLSQAFEQFPLGTALVKLDDGRTVASSKRAMVVLEAPSETGYFTKTDSTTGVVIDRTYPDEIPEIKLGENWLDTGVVDRVVFAPGNEYTPNPDVVGDPNALAPGISMLESAKDILRDFELTQQNQ